MSELGLDLLIGDIVDLIGEMFSVFVDIADLDACCYVCHPRTRSLGIEYDLQYSLGAHRRIFCFAMALWNSFFVDKEESHRNTMQIMHVQDCSSSFRSFMASAHRYCLGLGLWMKFGRHSSTTCFFFRARSGFLAAAYSFYSNIDLQ